MNEGVILPEMLEAGKAALVEGRNRDLSDLQMLIDVYLAMESTKMILEMRDRYRAVLH